MNTVSTNEFVLHLRPSRLIGEQMKGSPTLAPGRAGRFAAIESREREHHDVAMKSCPSVRSIVARSKKRSLVSLPSSLAPSAPFHSHVRPSPTSRMKVIISRQLEAIPNHFQGRSRTGGERQTTCAWTASSFHIHMRRDSQKGAAKSMMIFPT